MDPFCRYPASGWFGVIEIVLGLIGMFHVARWALLSIGRIRLRGRAVSGD